VEMQRTSFAGTLQRIYVF